MSVTDSRHEQLSSLNPPPEIVALGKPERVVMLSRFYGDVSSVMGRVATNSNVAGALAATVVGLVFMIASVVLKLRLGDQAPAVVIAILFPLGVLLLGVAFFLFSKLQTPDAAATPTGNEQDDKQISFAFAFYPQGLVHFNKGSWSYFQWDEVAEFRGAYAANPDAQVRLNNGQTILLRESDRDIFQDQPVLKQVELRITKVLLPRLLAKLDAGEELDFGGVLVSHQKVAYNGSSASWADVSRIEITPSGAATGGVGGALMRQHVTLKIAVRASSPVMAMPMGVGSVLPKNSSGEWHCGPWLQIPNRSVFYYLLRRYFAPHATWKIEPTTALFMPLDDELKSIAN